MRMPTNASKAKGHPVIIGRDVPHNGCPGEPADDRHQELEQPKVERQAKDRPRPGRARLRSCAKTDGKGIHGHADRDEEYFE